MSTRLPPNPNPQRKLQTLCKKKKVAVKVKMAVCKVCSQPLVVELDPESFDEATSSSVGEASTAPDDLLLACGCHFHWYV
jgi:hypothetical protein